MNIEVKYNAPHTLQRFLSSNAFIRFVVGPVGSGKSSCSIMEILGRAVEQRPGPDGVRRTRFAVIRNTYPELRDTTRKTFEQWIPQAPEFGQWNEQKFTYTMNFPHQDGSRVESEVMFRALDRPDDIKKLLSLELTGAYLNEAREIPKAVFDVLQTRVGRFPSMLQGGPSWYGIWGDTNPWHVGHWLDKYFKEQTLEGFELFEQPSGLALNAENLENLPKGYYQRLMVGKDEEWIGVYVKAKYLNSTVGSIYGALLDQLSLRGGITLLEPSPDVVFTSWDLGISDSTGIWFWRIGSNRLPEILDHYENHGLPFSHYVTEVKSKPYTYRKHYFPHDARARTLQTGTSILEQAIKEFEGTGVAITPELSLEDGIAATRWLFEQDIKFDSAKCAEGIRLLRAYRYSFDTQLQVYSRKPVHDFASHTSDAFRYLAVAYKMVEAATRPAIPPPPPDIRKLSYSFTLDDLFEQNETNKQRERY